MKDKYVGGKKMARNGGKMAKRKICVLFKFPDFSNPEIARRIGIGEIQEENRKNIVGSFSKICFQSIIMICNITYTKFMNS